MFGSPQCCVCVWTWVVPSVLTCWSVKVLALVVVRLLDAVVLLVVAPAFVVVVVVVVVLLPRFAPTLTEPTLLLTMALVMVHEPAPADRVHEAVPPSQLPAAELPPPSHDTSLPVVQVPALPLETVTTVPSLQRWEMVALRC